jgi:hypothetical protein
MRLGRIQRQCRRAFIAHDGGVLTSQLPEWASARRVLLERLPITRCHRLHARQRTTPWIVGIGPSSTIPAKALCMGLSWGGAQRSRRQIDYDLYPRSRSSGFASGCWS